jgi:kinesin family protein 4/21/27
MIACIAPVDAYLEENASTLNYATKASNISNEPIRNVDPKTKVMRELKSEVATLKKELAEAYKHIDILNNVID